MNIAPLAAAVSLMLAGSVTGSGNGGAPTMKMWRLDCGTVAANDLNEFSDTQAYSGQRKTLVSSCYLIRHGDTYMLWDAGIPASLKGKLLDLRKPMDFTVTKTIPEQLAELGLSPDAIELLGISHYHSDHVGQAASFPRATLLIGKDDFDAVRAGSTRLNLQAFEPWTKSGGKTDPVTGDRDVFGDGTVTMIALPGHTPGHHGLLVRLQSGTFLLSGDVTHFLENYDSNGVPTFNADRPGTLASLDRFKTLARNLGATVIIQHEAADVAKLPAFPDAAQ